MSPAAFDGRAFMLMIVARMLMYRYASHDLVD